MIRIVYKDLITGLNVFNLLSCYQEKCAKYWPEVNEALFYGDIIVKLETESHLPDYILRIFTLRTVSMYGTM